MRKSYGSLIEQLQADTAALALPEGRRVGQPGHEAARLFLTRRMADLKLEPFRGGDFSLIYERPHARDSVDQVFTNLVGVIPGRNRDLPPILLGAHYDSVIDAPCADDNATSVALNLAIAERFQEKSATLERDLIIALFDAEEPPHFQRETMGSTRFHEDHCRGIDFAAVIVSDLIGHDLELADLARGVSFPGMSLFEKRVGRTVFVLGAESDSVFPGIVETAAAETDGIHIFPTLNRYIGNLSDHHSFEQQGQPFLFLSCGQGRHYHSRQDTLDWINFAKLGRIVEFVAALIEKIDRRPGDRARERDDPFEFEMRMIRKLAGPFLPVVLKLAGVPMPKDRDDLDLLIESLVGGIR